MSLLEDYRDQFLLESMELYREFDMSHFISNAKTGITGKIESVKFDHDFNKNIGMLEKSVPVVAGFSLDKSSIDEFMNAYNHLGENLGTIAVNDLHDLSAIIMKPQYLAQYTEMIQKIIDNVITGKMTEEDALPFISGEAALRVQKQVVRASVSLAGYDPKAMYSKLPKQQTTTLDDRFIKGKMLQFVTNFEKNKGSVVAEANATVNAVKEAYITLQKMILALNEIKHDSSIDMEKNRILGQVSYNAMRGLIDITTYMTFMQLTKIAYFQDDINTCRQIFVDITNKNNGMMAATESVMDAGVIPMDTNSLTEDMIQGKVDAFTTFAKNIYQFHAGIPGVGMMDEPVRNLGDATHSLVDMKLDEEPYNGTAYEEAGKMYIAISNGLDLIARTSDDYLFVIDDIMNEAGFVLRLEDRFRNTLAMLDDISMYDGANNLTQSSGIDPAMYARMLAEVKAYPENMQKIANIVLDTKSKMSMLSERYAKNINGEFKDVESISELKLFLNDLSQQYTDITNIVCGKFMKRLREIGNILSAMEASDKQTVSDTTPIETSSNLDFTEGVLEEMLSDYEESTKSIFYSLQQEYFTEKERVLRGINVIFEADEPTTSNPTDTTKTATEPKASTSVSVQDNSTEAKGTVGKIAAKVSAWFRTMIDKFMDFIGKQGTKNQKWLTANKDALIGRSYNNVTINILPYKNVPAQTISDNIKKLINSVKSMTPQNIQGIKDKATMYKKLFPFVKGGIVDGTPLKDQFTKYYKVGTAEMTTVPIANGELKSEITGTIIPFCEQFYNNFSASIKTDLTQLGDAVDAALSSYSTQPTTESVSIYTEAEDNTQTSMVEKGKWMQEATKLFAGSIMNAVRDRNNDYMKVLSSLVPKAPVAPAQPEEQPEAQA